MPTTLKALRSVPQSLNLTNFLIGKDEFSGFFIEWIDETHDPKDLGAGMIGVEATRGRVRRMEVINLVERCVRETAAERGVEIPAGFDQDAPLFGRSGLFDSMGLVSLVVAVEEAISVNFGVEIALADQRALSERRSPFRSQAALAEYAARLIGEAR